ncbi:hypothetical protein Vi05172_g5884 [Venturia inaequalis]|nr:hypothetical protein Vi05172_g5884 [Venturia inaequalis]
MFLYYARGIRPYKGYEVPYKGYEVPYEGHEAPPK